MLETVMKRFICFAVLLNCCLAAGCAPTGIKPVQGPAVVEKTWEDTGAGDLKKNTPNAPATDLQSAPVQKTEREKALETEILKRFAPAFKHRITDAISPDNPAKGPLDAPVTIIQYTSFQCAACGHIATGELEQVLAHYKDKVRLVFKNNPLPYQRRALPAAKAALAAHKQGKFWEFHDMLYNDPRGTRERTILNAAEQLGLDVAQFNRDRNSRAVASQIAAEQARAAELGFTDVPVFIVNGVVMAGLFPKVYFTTVIDRLMMEQVGRGRGAGGQVSRGAEVQVSRGVVRTVDFGLKGGSPSSAHLLTCPLRLRFSLKKHQE